MARSLPEADRWIAPYMALPFVERGRSMAGVDCRGLTLLVLERETGVHVPDPEHLYAATDRRSAADLADVVRREQRRWRTVEPDAAGGYPRFSVLLFAIGGLPTHVASSMGGRLFLHAQKGCGVRVGDLDEAEAGEGRWGDRLQGAFVYDR